jgi:hypothetical protein
MTRYQRLPLVTLAFAVLCAHPRSSSAQGIATTFGELAGRLRAGTTVYVTDDAGVKRKGDVAALSSSTLELSIDGKRQIFLEDGVRQITERRRSTGKGAKIGLAVGAGLALFAALSSSECEGCRHGPDALVPVTVAGLIGMGAGVGAAIGAAFTHEQVVYQAPSQTPPRIQPSLIVRRHQITIAGSLAF